MAKFDAVVNRQTVDSAEILDGRHPAVVRVMEFKADSGEVPAGEIVAKDALGLISSYDPDAVSANATLAVPVGVNLFPVDTAKDSLGNVVVHGTVIRSSLKTEGAEAADVDKDTLEQNTQIWAF
ncbi:hypothetical protein [Limisalsivibrio acetivorans]|uniref:hypothetical protein n=1 Tax=Limisalsivibrio acetivorans TaxID=1304888 RepID=UPI0003B4CE16|nr:hypothetical protein [Limisalsivibrio acetivorans]